METKGNPVDSVIQYQLHKQENGGSGSECYYKTEKPLILEPLETTVFEEVTQEDLDNDILLVASEAEIGDKYVKIKFNLSINDLFNDKLSFFIVRNTDTQEKNMVVVEKNCIFTGEKAVDENSYVFFNFRDIPDCLFKTMYQDEEFLAIDYNDNLYYYLYLPGGGGGNT